MQAAFLLTSLDSVFSAPLYKARSGRVDANSHYNVLTFKSMSDAVALCRRVMILAAHTYLFRSSYRFVQWCKMLSRTREETESYSDGFDCSASRNSE